MDTALRPLLVALALTMLAACGDATRHQVLDPGTVVLALGNSITHGTGAKRGQDYPTLLAQHSGWEVINAGVPGDRASGARQRLPGLLEEHRPELVIVEIGGNDFLRKRPETAVRRDILAIIELARESGAQVVLVAVPRLSLLRASVGALDDAQLYAELALETGAILVGDILSAVLSEDDLRADRIHPNATGYRVFSEQLASALRNEGLLQ